MKKRIAILFALLTMAVSAPAYAATYYYVSPTGSDSNAGTSESAPLATIGAAADKIKAKRTGDFVIRVMSGEYNLTESINFTSANSGSANKKISIVGYGDTNPVFKSAAVIPASKFQTPIDENILALLPGESLDKVKCVDLDDYGVGAMTRPLISSGETVGEAYADGVAMNIAQYPNPGEGYLSVGTVTGSGTKTPYFKYSDSRIDSFIDVGNIYAYSGWAYYWESASYPVSTIDTTNKTITLTRDRPLEVVSGQEYYLYNVVEDLDVPGEYYIDKTNNIMYFYPPENMQVLEVSKTINDAFSLEQAKYLTFENLDFDVSGGQGFSILGSNNITVKNCNFKNLGNRAITVNASGTTQSSDVTIQNCTVTECGTGGFNISAGVRTTLTHGNVVVDGCDIYKCYRRGPFDESHCISLSGCGNTVKNTKMHDMGGTAIHVVGNEHSILNNEIYNTCWATYDQGALYMHGDWSYCGNVIEGNYFHHINGRKSTGVRAVYFDNMVSGNTVSKNIFAYCDDPVFVHGGKNFTIEDNIFFDCENSASVYPVSGYENGDVSGFVSKLDSLDVYSGVWFERYPWLAAAYDEHKAGDVSAKYPKGNIVRNNVSYNSGKCYMHPTYALPYGGVFENNTTGEVVIYK